MSAEKRVYDNIGGRALATALQLNFFNIVDTQRLKLPASPPCRTLSTFWAEDVLPTVQAVRRIYCRNYNPEDSGILTEVWQWTQKPANVELIQKKNLAYEGFVDALPLPVLLNLETAYFFTMADEFKRPEISLKLFEPYVSYKPGTADWENDLRGETFEFTTGLGTRRIENPDRSVKSPLAALESVRKRVDGNLDLIEMYEGWNAVTWAVVMRYHLRLLQRERYTLSKVFS